MTPDILFAGLDEVLILRLAYTTAAILGVPCALWCLWSSLASWRSVKRAGLNGGLEQAARGYQRRDTVRLLSLGLILSAGVVAISGSLPLRSVFGLGVLLTLALMLAADGIADYRERRATVEPALHSHTWKWEE